MLSESQMLKRLAFTAVLLLGGAIFVRADGASPPVRPFKYPLNDLTIRLERKGCYGRCPIYSVEIHGDGRVVYEGRRFVGVTGRREGKIAQDQVVELLNHIYHIRFFDMRDEYSTRPDGVIVENGEVQETVIISSDLESKVISVKVGDYEKSVVDYDGSPPELVALSPRIDQIADTAKWTK
jgi:hypothetical protein